MSLLLARVAQTPPSTGTASGTISISGTATAEPVPVADSSLVGGYARDTARDLVAERQRARLRRRITQAEEEELAQLVRAKIARDEKPPASPELERIRALVAEYASREQSEYLTRRGQRAVAYAMRAQTELALQLAAREIARFEEEAIAAVLALALDD